MLVCLCFFFVFLFNFYFLLGLFVFLLVLTRVWYFTHKSHNGEVAIFFCFWFVLYSLCSIFSFGLCFFFLFFCLIFTSFLVCLFVCLFWRECDILLTSLTMEKLRFFLFLVCSIFSFGEKKSRFCLSLHSLTTDSNSLYQNYKAINSFPKYSLCRKLTLGLYVCSQSTEAAFNESRGVIFFAC